MTDTITMNVTLRPTGITINGNTVTAAPRIEQILGLMEKMALREKELFDCGTLWRKFVTLDEAGIYMLYDAEIDRVISIDFCFDLSSSPQSPRASFSGLLFVNGSRLVSGMKEKVLPLSGEFTFSKNGSWTATKDKLFVEIRTSRSQKTISAVSISFLQHPPFKGK